MHNLKGTPGFAHNTSFTSEEEESDDWDHCDDGEESEGGNGEDGGTMMLAPPVQWGREVRCAKEDKMTTKSHNTKTCFCTVYFYSKGTALNKSSGPPPLFIAALQLSVLSLYL